AAVLDALASLRQASLLGTLGDSQRLTVGTFLRRWLDDAMRPALRETTHWRYEQMLRLHIVPQIGGVVLTRLTPAHVVGLLASMEHAERSARLRQIAYNVLHRALNQALKWG